MTALDPVFPILARLVIALLFAGAARHKLRDLLRFEGIVADYRLAPAGWSFGIARGLVALEVGLVVGLLLPWTAAAASLGAGFVLLGYAIAIAVNLARGRSEIECGCGGPGESLHPRLLLRNAVLIGACLVAATTPAPRGLVALDLFTIGSGLLTVTLLWAAGGRLVRVVDGSTA